MTTNQGTQQSLRFGPITLAAAHDLPAPYFLSGRKLYAIGSTNGKLEPVGAEHLVGEMGGVWAHPVKFLEGWYFAVEDAGGYHDQIHCRAFEGHLSDVQLEFAHGPLRLLRTDVVADDDAALCSLLEISNTGDEAWSGTIGCVAEFSILPCWFSGWEPGGTEIIEDRGRAVAYDKLWEGRWGAVFGCARAPAEVRFGQRNRHTTAELRFTIALAAGEKQSLECLLACDHQRGHEGAQQLFDQLIGRGQELLQRKRERYHELAFGGVTLHTPDERVNHGWALAKANLLMLEAEYAPYHPGYLLAGIPEYPQLFGCDNTYTTPGATGAGFAPFMRSTLRALGEYAQRACGRVPHEITTNGRVFNPGNTQETPQLAIAVWDYVRWTGDLALLREMYPVCREGVMEYLPGVWGGGKHGYPAGDAMVERHGMGSRKLDSACYLYGAWRALANMARALQRPEADVYTRLAEDWRERFERDWWLPDAGLYADSLHGDGRPQLDGHWTQVVPVQLGIARLDRAQQVLDALERDYTNRWGLVHTRVHDERVWTLPTGLMVLAELQHGRIEHALQFLHNISSTVEHGMLGAFKELIPEGLCFVQLWSAGLYLQSVLEGLLGFEPCAHEHRITIAPTMPTAWPAVTVRGVRVGQHTLNLEIRPVGCRVEHIGGEAEIDICFVARGTSVATLNRGKHQPAHAQIEHTEHGAGIRFRVAVGHTVELLIADGAARVTHVVSALR